jgi:hypothetical protein
MGREPGLEVVSGERMHAKRETGMLLEGNRFLLGAASKKLIEFYRMALTKSATVSIGDGNDSIPNDPFWIFNYGSIINSPMMESYDKHSQSNFVDPRQAL